ncbi:class II aldolase/adducin family protein [Ruicaihuangia caeni]|uniref:Class II aldolase/adducin family protein n=1 Tax=Ruicaihuangia caeni TaxID=3042517 RepID=A0AAW6T9G3_9MICO|nr:class II aldolase/adducin family protein [Klugiella sp. YN-L-19]MDI2099431.1 class II aldolase/adducin family protein [Klugiella sp. YN-L-19]
MSGPVASVQQTEADLDAARRALVAAGAKVVALGLSPGTSGNLSVRFGDRVLISPTGVSLADLTTERITLMDAGGAHLDGPPPSKEYPFHLAFYSRDAAVRAVVHLHSSHAAAQACLPSWTPQSALPPLTPYLVMRVGQVPLIEYAAPGDLAQAEAIRRHPLDFSSVLLANHGSVTSGADLDQAIDRAIEIEEASKLLGIIGGRAPRLLDAAQVSELTARYGTAWTLEA